MGREDSSLIEVLDQEATDYGTLEGEDSYEHPDADPVKGVTGNVTLSWRLTRR